MYDTLTTYLLCGVGLFFTAFAFAGCYHYQWLIHRLAMEQFDPTDRASALFVRYLYDERHRFASWYGRVWFILFWQFYTTPFLLHCQRMPYQYQILWTERIPEPRYVLRDLGFWYLHGFGLRSFSNMYFQLYCRE